MRRSLPPWETGSAERAATPREGTGARQRTARRRPCTITDKRNAPSPSRMPMCCRLHSTPLPRCTWRALGRSQPRREVPRRRVSSEACGGVSFYSRCGAHPSPRPHPRGLCSITASLAIAPSCSPSSRSARMARCAVHSRQPAPPLWRAAPHSSSAALLLSPATDSEAASHGAWSAAGAAGLCCTPGARQVHGDRHDRERGHRLARLSLRMGRR